MPRPDVVPSGERFTLAELGNALLVAELASRSGIGAARPETRYSMGAILVALVWKELNSALAAHSETGRAEVLGEVSHVVGEVLSGRVPRADVVKSLRARG